MVILMYVIRNYLAKSGIVGVDGREVEGWMEIKRIYSQLGQWP